jgi:hypothetical protein
MNSQDRFRIPSPKVEHEIIDNEAVIIEFQSGSYYSLDSVGTDILELIAEGASLEETVENIACRYQGTREQIDKAVKQLLSELLQEGLLVQDNQESEQEGKPGPQIESPPETQKPEIQTPVLKKYTDMQELLLLDPIHEVDEAGWPHAKPGSTDGE